MTPGVDVENQGDNTVGNVVVKARGQNTVTTAGTGAHGIYGDHSGTGDMELDVRNATIVTESIDLNPTCDDTLSHGIYANQIGMGDVDIDIQGGSIETRGAYSYGVYGRLTKADHGGLLSIRTGGGHTITTTGKSGHGIVAYNYGTLPTSTTPINVGGNITTTGAGAQGVRVGALSSGAPVRVAAIGDDGYRQQTVTVNGSVMGNAVGIFLAGGGRVVIGPRGSIGATSGIAILATGDTPGADPLDPLLKPKLRVDMNLGGRRVARAIGRNWIINDGGETTIAVNGVVLHEGATGVMGLTARNGAWNVRMREEGVNVTDYTDSDPANWVVSESAAGVVADRDFSAQDFNERRKPTPPPPMCPPGQVGTPPDCSVPEEPEPEPETGTPMLVEEYAPRAALYEVLPDFMLRMQNWAPTRQRLFLPESPVYIRLLGSTGSQEFKRSTVNANYDAGRFAVEAGVKIPLSEDFGRQIHGCRGLRVSFSNTDRFTGGLGVMAESVRTEYGGELLLRGSLDFEQKFGDSKTVTLVSGERLSAEPEKSSALLSLSGTWHKGPFKFSAELSARQDFNSGGEDYSGVIHVGMNF